MEFKNRTRILLSVFVLAGALIATPVYLRAKECSEGLSRAKNAVCMGKPAIEEINFAKRSAESLSLIGKIFEKDLKDAEKKSYEMAARQNLRAAVYRAGMNQENGEELGRAESFARMAGGWSAEDKLKFDEVKKAGAVIGARKWMKTLKDDLKNGKNPIYPLSKVEEFVVVAGGTREAGIEDAELREATKETILWLLKIAEEEKNEGADNAPTLSLVKSYTKKLGRQISLDGDNGTSSARPAHPVQNHRPPVALAKLARK